jgi:hypothetical protein
MGNYIKTVYPFPSTYLENIDGLVWKDYPHGYKRPQKNGINQSTFLTSGNENTKQFKQAGAYTMSVWSSGEKGNIALAKISLNRISTLGDSAKWEDKKLDLNGPDTWLELDPKKPFKNLHEDTRVCPYSSAFSPDGKKIYLTGYNNLSGRRKQWLDGVMVMDFASNEKPKVFVGEFKNQNGMTTSVACDKEGRVYVANYTDHSIDVYSPEAKLLKKIPIDFPTSIHINQKNGEIYVFSWYVGGIIWDIHPALKSKKPSDVSPALTIIHSFEDNKIDAKYNLPYIPKYKGGGTEFNGWGEACHGTQYRAAVDFWSEKPTIWLITKNPMGIDIKGTEGMFNWGSGWENSGPILLHVEGK